ncbi:MAG: nitroreductase family protein, partial [Eubacteriales bacterium]|nr:nitroreductase family protein [Eubacteriales bacterium]
LVLIFAADYARWYRAFAMVTDGQARKPGPGDMLLCCADALIAAQNAVVAAEALGLGSCYIGDILEQVETHRELLYLPDYVLPVAMLCIGHATDQQKARKKPCRFEKECIVMENGYHQPADAAFQQGFTQYFAANGRQDAAFDTAVAAIYRRKYDSSFTREMNRSAGAYLAQWQQD